MEKIETYNNGSRFARNFITTALLSSVLLWAASCWKATSKDIIDQKEKIELLAYNTEHYVNARKEVVNKYNTILSYPRTDANKYEIDNHLYLLEKEIEDYDEKIENLVKDKIDAERTLNKKVESRWTTWIHTPLDPNKRDYLLAIQ